MKSGIYKIQNKLNNKIYIGSSIDINKRFREHKRMLRNNIHHSIHLQRACNIDGLDSFDFLVLENCQIEECLKKEQEYIEKLKPEYNISLSSSCPMLGRKHKKSTLKKFKNRKYSKGKDHYAYGTTLSKERVKRIIEDLTGRKHSEKTKEKMSNTSKKLNRYKDLLPYIETIKKPIKDNLNNQFDSLTKAAKYHNMSIQACCDILKGRSKKSKKGIIFYYV